MPRFSIIVPTHDVPGRLSDCLSSVLKESFTDFELIAVIDESEELCATTVADHAQRDPRVRVTSSPRAGGLPGARNAGMATASGDYLMFLDGDDTLVPGTLSAVDACLGRTGDPDLLLFDHERVHWFHGSQGPVLRRLTENAPSRPFSAHEHAALPDPLVPAFSGAYRRAFLRERGLTFTAGMFTDVPWSVLTVLHADRIALLDRVCVRHLQRRQGARNRVGGVHHLDLLDQFDVTMRRTAALGLPPELVSRTFLRLSHALLKTASSPWRLPSARVRRRFFRRASRLYRLHRPAGFGPPGGSLGLQHRLLAFGAYTGFRVLRGAKRRLSGVAVRARAFAGRTYRRVHHPYRRYLKRPIDENLAVYSSYWGRGYTCNPAAIHAAARRLAPHIRSVFLVSEPGTPQMPDGVECVVIGSRRYWEVMATAKYTFNNVNFEMSVKKRPGTVHVQTQHGTPLKRMGIDQIAFPAAASAAGSFGKLLQRVDRWDFNISSNTHSTEVWERAYPGAYESLDVGYPRNDAFYRSTAQDVAAIRARFGIPDNRIAVLYAPTHRDYRTGFTPQIDLAAFCDELGDEFVVLLRAHHFHDAEAASLEETLRAGKLINLTEHRLPEEVCLAADALITDYSSIMFDYANLDRPIVIHADDWEIYKETRGVYFDLPATPPGPVTRTPEDLVRVFRDGSYAGPESAALRARFRERFCQFDDGHAAERVVRRVLLGEPPEALPPVIPLAERTPAPAAAPLVRS
jgi:CDP-glycerol glycerophosphotransferase (TagB/SpsB family)